MKVIPKENYVLLGTGFRLNKTRVYEAIHATNQPNWRKRRAIFVIDGDESMLLEGDDYRVADR